MGVAGVLGIQSTFLLFKQEILENISEGEKRLDIQEVGSCSRSRVVLHNFSGKKKDCQETNCEEAISWP